MKTYWFKKCGWFYLPVSWPGAVTMILALLFCLNVFIAVDRRSHSVSDTLYGIFPFFGCCFLLVNWVAANSCEKGRLSLADKAQESNEK